MVESVKHHLPGDSIRDQTLSPNVGGHDFNLSKRVTGASPSQKGHFLAELPGPNPEKTFHI